jgi:gas vesicle protein
MTNDILDKYSGELTRAFKDVLDEVLTEIENNKDEEIETIVKKVLEKL